MFFLLLDGQIAVWSETPRFHTHSPKGLTRLLALVYHSLSVLALMIRKMHYYYYYCYFIFIIKLAHVSQMASYMDIQ